MLWLSAFFELESGEDAVADIGEAGDAADRLRGLVDADLMMLNALQLLVFAGTGPLLAPHGEADARVSRKSPVLVKARCPSAPAHTTADAPPACRMH